MNFSIVIITKNEGGNLESCLQALLPLSDDIVIVDSGSTDGTKAIALGHKCRFIETEWMGYAQTKNYGHSRCKYDWILSIDADEVVSEELARSLQNCPLEKGKVYSLDRITQLDGRWVKHSGWYPDWKVRLFDRNEAEWKGEQVHEYLDYKAAQVVPLEGKLYHYSYKDGQDHIDRMYRYAALSAEALYDAGKKPSYFKRYLAPWARLFGSFVLKKGFLDGSTGLKIALRDFKMVRYKYRVLQDLYRKR